MESVPLRDMTAQMHRRDCCGHPPHLPAVLEIVDGLAQCFLPWVVVTAEAGCWHGKEGRSTRFVDSPHFQNETGNSNPFQKIVNPVSPTPLDPLHPPSDPSLLTERNMPPPPPVALIVMVHPAMDTIAHGTGGRGGMLTSVSSPWSGAPCPLNDSDPQPAPFVSIRTVCRGLQLPWAARPLGHCWALWRAPFWKNYWSGEDLGMGVCILRLWGTPGHT